uniref:Integration host factor subunit beta n=1 Tax=Candidatus Kentrum eta TaxID=2126337 RepID=A0A450VEH4_9GAMM|nr:MAG: integration host factor subunit beta [Candidatus Kentron sp. H]VFJ97533.1 MAG: integration host factor subunit beta [Candidatus Kentron sp. H]VFK03203.1 MAG: integration host factor subunit beta [Candidatus Kentron sp. H]
MTKSEFIDWLARRQMQLDSNDVDQAVNIILESIASTLAVGERVEIRSFGSFSLHYRPQRIGRNPKSGDLVSIVARHVPYFKPGKQLRESVNSVKNDPDAGIPIKMQSNNFHNTD